MKKLLSVLLMVVIATTLLTGCGEQQPVYSVYDDLTNYLNVEMEDINAQYEKLKEEVSKWETFEDDVALANNLNEVLIPLVDESLAKLEEIEPETEEVKAVKEKYVKVIQTYKEGFSTLAEGCETQSEDLINAGVEGLSKAIDLLGEYNVALEELAKECGATIEY